MKGYTLWLTGLPCSGKTTIANRTAEILRNFSIDVVVLDGDIVRKKITVDCGYTREGRDKNITRIADICELITNNNVINIASVVSPTKKIRDYARKNIKNFSEIYIKCPQTICEKRDTKGYYKDYNQGILKNFVGKNIVYEEPKNPNLILETAIKSLDECCIELISHLFTRWSEDYL